MRYLSSLGGSNDSTLLIDLCDPILFCGSMLPRIYDSGRLGRGVGDFDGLLPSIRFCINLIFDFEAYADIRLDLLFNVLLSGSGLKLTGDVLPLIKVPETAAGGNIAFINCI